MKPAIFQYFKPANLADALDLLRRYPDDSKIIAGGQSLVPVMNMRLAQPRYLIDINGLTDLGYIRVEGNEIAVGSLSRHHDLEMSPVLAEHNALLQHAASLIGHISIRYRGTIGGSLSHADPAATLPLALTCLGGSVTVEGPGGARALPVESFFLGLFMTALEPGELLTEVRVPALTPGTGWGFSHISRRHGDFPLVSACCLLVLRGGLITGASLALGGVGPGPVRVDAAAATLMGRRPGPEAFAEAAKLAQAAADPEDDIHASAAYRRDMVAVMTERALNDAMARAQGQSGATGGGHGNG